MKLSKTIIPFGICAMLIISSFGMMASTGQIDDDTYILRVAMQDDIKTLNPLVAGDVWTWNVIGYLYEGPLNTDPDTDELIPYIAVGSANLSTDQNNIDWDDCTIGNFGYSPKEVWNDSEKQETIIFYDFTDVRWHDGTQMDIRDVMFSYHMQAQLPDWQSDVRCLMDEGGEGGSNFTDTNYLHIQKVYESEDGLQAGLRFQLQTPFAAFLRNTLSSSLLPYHIWGTTASGQALDNTLIWLDDGYTPNHVWAWDSAIALAWDNPNPVGSGPFMFESWNVGVNSKIATYRDHFYKYGWNPEYDPDGIAKQPTIEAIVFEIYKTAEQAVLALKNNDVDYIAWSIPPTFVQEMMNEPDLGVIQSAEKGFFYLGYNMRPSRRSFGYDENGTDIGKPLRRAIAHCIDKQTIVQRLLQNFGIPGNGPISEISEWYNSSIPKYAFDPQEGKQILADAGYMLEDGSTGQEAFEKAGVGNWWLNPDGSPIGNSEGGKIRILTPPADYDPIHSPSSASYMMARQMQDIGLYAESVAMDFGTITAMIQDREFDIYIQGWRIGSDPTDSLYAFFHSDNADASDNFPGYSNESFDELIDLARETDDEDIRMKCILDAQSSIAYDLPYDVLYFRTNIEAYRSDRFTGWETGPCGSIYNLRSIQNLRPPSGKWLNTKFVNMDSAAQSNSTIDVEVLVTCLEKNSDGSISRGPAENAYVELSTSNGTLSELSGYTDSGGMLRITYTAPYVPPTNDHVRNGTPVIIEIKSAELFDNDTAASKVTLLTVYPESVNFLNVQMEVDPDVIFSQSEGGEPSYATLEVLVTDQNDNPVSGAEYFIQLYPEGPNISSEVQYTDDDGMAYFTISSVGSDDSRSHTISAIVFKNGYKNGTQSITLDILKLEVMSDPLGPSSDLSDYVVPAVILMGCGVLAGVAIVSVRRKKKL